MRIPVIAGGVALCAGIVFGVQILTVPQVASAQTVAVSILKTNSNENTDVSEKIIEDDDQNVVKVAVDTVVKSSSDNKEEKISEESPEVVHVVKKGESLEIIAKEYDITEWTRIFDKNEDIVNPDILNVGQKLVIPEENEELEKRELPASVEPVVTDTRVSGETVRSQVDNTGSSATSRSSTQRGSTAGNGYSYGYCTWFVKNMRPDLPNNLGNANTWFSRASAQGYATGYTPRVGAVAEALSGYMHVAYVTSVHGDGTVTVSEMNFNGWGVQSSRRVAASDFRYIY